MFHVISIFKISLLRMYKFQLIGSAVVSAIVTEGVLSLIGFEELCRPTKSGLISKLSYLADQVTELSDVILMSTDSG